MTIEKVKTAIKLKQLQQEIIEEVENIYVIHYSPTAKQIYHNKKFLYGEKFAHNLDYTLGDNNKIKKHSEPGFNFAFHLENYSEEHQCNEYMLSEHGLLDFACQDNATIFKIKKGLYTHHVKDRFNQIIFFHEDIVKDSFIYMERAPLDIPDIYDENGNNVKEYWKIESGDFIFDNKELAFNTEECIEYIKEKLIKNENKKRKNYIFNP